MDSRSILFAFRIPKNFLFVVLGVDEHIKIIPPRLEDPFGFLWSYLPLATSLAIGLAYTLSDYEEAGLTRLLREVTIFYSTAVVALSVITAVEPITGLFRYFSTCASFTLLIILPKGEPEGRVPIVLPLLLWISLVSTLTNGSLISDLDAFGYGIGNKHYPPETQEVEALSKVLSLVEPENIVVMDIRQGHGIKIANARLLSSRKTKIDKFKLLGSFGYTLDEAELAKACRERWILMLREPALKYMRNVKVDMRNLKVNSRIKFLSMSTTFGIRW